MKITAALVWISLCLASGFSLFSIAFAVEDLEAELSAINRQIEQEREALHVLQAEWTYLNRPDRIEDLAQQLLPDLTQPAIEQLVAVEDIPLAPPVPPSSTLPDAGSDVGPDATVEMSSLTSGAEAPAVTAPRRSTLGNPPLGKSPSNRVASKPGQSFAEKVRLSLSQEGQE